MNLNGIKFKSDLHEYCLICLFLKKGFSANKQVYERYVELDEIWKHHRLSKHPNYTEIIKEIQNQFVHAHNRVLLREFEIEEKQQMEMESFDELLKNCSIIIKN